MCGLGNSRVDAANTERRDTVASGSHHVLVVAPQCFYEDRGTPIAVRYVVQALSELGYQVDVLTLPLGRPIQIPNVRLIRLANPLRIRHVPVGLSLGKVFFDILLIHALRKQLDATPYVCIHAVEEAAFPAVFFGRRRGIPVVYDMQSSLPEQLAQNRLFRFPPVFRFLRRCERWLLSNAQAVIGSSGLAVSARAAVPDAPIAEWTFPSHSQNAAPAEISHARDNLGIPSGWRTVVYCGTFAEYQGLENVLAAIPMVIARLPHLVFVFVGGSGLETAALKRRVAYAGLEPHVRVLDRQARETIPAFLGMADVLISSRSHGGNLPLKIFDYLAAGRPIVATDIPSHRSILNDDRAFLVEPNAEGLAEGIVQALTDVQRAESVVTHAQLFAQQHLGFPGFRSGLKDVYDRVLSKSDASADEPLPQ